MDMAARRQYFEILQEKYHKSKKREEKTAILNEYCKNTKQNRKYVIQKFNCFLAPPHSRKKRPKFYDFRVISALHTMWEIFDCPCGQRLKSSLEKETDRMKAFGELKISEATVEKLKKISSATIDRKLKFWKNRLTKGYVSNKNNNNLLSQKIKTKTHYQQDRNNPGLWQVDIVENCGASATGTYVCTVDFTNLATGWTETEGIMGKGQTNALEAFKNIRRRSPIEIAEIHPDNDGSFINWHLVKYCENEGIAFSRSRRYKKNDNAYVEQKNYTHVRKVFGHIRYDTQEELDIINDLDHNELRLYKNFFQPVMFLKEKKRVKSKVIRRYDKQKTPFERTLELPDVPTEIKQELRRTYQTLNPAEVKRRITKKIRLLFKVHQTKKKKFNPAFDKILAPTMKNLGKVLYDLTGSHWVR